MENNLSSVWETLRSNSHLPTYSIYYLLFYLNIQQPSLNAACSKIDGFNANV